MAGKLRVSRRTIAELSFLLRAVLDDLAARGGPQGKAHRSALDCIDAFVKGEPLEAGAVLAARAEIKKLEGRVGAGGPPLWLQLTSLPVEPLLRMAEGDDDRSAIVSERVAEMLRRAEAAGASERFEAMRSEARARAETIDDSLPADEGEGAREAQLLAMARASFEGQALALFDFVGPARDARKTARRADLSRRLEERGLPACAAVLSFEESFGGLLIPVTTEERWREHGLCTLVGAWAMLEEHPSFDLPNGGTTAEQKRLIPVARGTQEDVYFLDEEGGPYYHETIGEAGAVPFGRDARELVARLMFCALTYASQTSRGTPVFPTLERVRAVGPGLGLERVFADATSEWWFGDAAVVVGLQGQVWGIARTEAAAESLGAG